MFEVFVDDADGFYRDQMNLLFSENMQKMPRTINFISTPALAASYNLSISFSSEREFIFRVMAAVFFSLAAFDLPVDHLHQFLPQTGGAGDQGLAGL